jgi:hypothetical protein
MSLKYSLKQAVICMSDNINQMNYKQLRNEVQLLRDELAIMQRKFEDIIYNLDTDNFSSRFTREQKNMKSAIEFTAEGIKTKVSKEDLDKSLSNYSTIEQTADKISTAVSSVNNSTDKKLENYSTIEQTASQISASVKETKEYAEEYVTDALANGDYVTNATFKSQFDIYANGIYTTVEETYETKNDANSSYSNLRSSISSVSQTANSIETKVGKLENGQYGNYTLFKQTDDTFLFDGDYMRISSAIMLTDDSGNHTFSIFHNEGNGVSAGRRGTYMCGVSLNLATPDPLMIGASNQSVYLYDAVEDNLIATRGWVLDNAGAGGGTVVAVFG